MSLSIWRRVFLCSSFIAASLWVEAAPGGFRCDLINKERLRILDYPVVVSLDGIAAEWVVVDNKGNEIPSQVDDTDGDGRADELCFLVNLNAGERGSYTARPTDRSASYPVRTHAQLIKRNADKTITVVDSIGSPTGDLYRLLHHHGPAFESEKIAYRLYFDRKQTIDVYGKKQARLELDEAKWYPTDEHLARGFGDDVLIVSQSVSVGTLRGWDPVGRKSVHIDPVDYRRARIVAQGPLRTIVNMEVEGWNYFGRKIDLTSQYILYAGSRVVEVNHRVETTSPETLIFSTGVQRMPEIESYRKNSDGTTMAVWGRGWPVNDTVKYAKETVGLTVSIPKECQIEVAEDKYSYLCLVRPDAKGKLSWRFAAYSCKEADGPRTEEEFHRVAPTYFHRLQVEVRIKKM